MGGKASKSKSVDITVPSAENAAEEKVVKEGNGVADISSEQPLVKSDETPAANDTASNNKESKESAAADEIEKIGDAQEKNEEKEKIKDVEKEKAKEPEKEKTKDKQKDKDKDKEKDKEKEKDKKEEKKEKTKDKEKDKTKDKEKASEDDKKKKKEKKRSFSFLSKKPKKSKEGANGDIEAKGASEESKTEVKEAPKDVPATAKSDETESSNVTATETTEEAKVNEEKSEAKEESVQVTADSQTKSDETTVTEAPAVVENEPKKEEAQIASVNVSELKSSNSAETASTIETSPKETLSESVLTKAADVLPVSEEVVAIKETTQQNLQEENLVNSPEKEPVEVKADIPSSIPESCSTNVEAQIESPQSPNDELPPVEMELEKEIVTDLPEPNIPDAIEEPEQASKTADTFDEIPPPVEPVCNEISSNVDLDASPVNPDSCGFAEQLACSPTKDDFEKDGADDVCSVSATASDFSNRSSADVAVDQVFIPPPVDLQIETESAAESNKYLTNEQLNDESPSSPVLLSEPTVVVQAATPEPLSDENVEPVASLPSPPAMIEGSSASSLDSVEKIPSPPPVNDADLPIPIENHDNHEDELPSPNEEIQEKPIVTKKTSVMNTKIVWEHGGSEVSMTGSFMDWADSLQLIESDGVFSVAVDLPEGEHYCKFLVDGSWTVNSAQPVYELDGQGQVNVIMVKVGNEE